MSSVFYRVTEPIEAVAAEGCWITDRAGNRYLDAAGGAIVCGIGHGRTAVAQAIADQLTQLDYVHASTFTTPVTEEYCNRVAALVPMDDARVYPVSGGSEATETVLKMIRAYQVSQGRPDRTVVLARQGSYHGNTLGALDLSGRERLRAPYLDWLGRFRQVPDDLDRLAEEIARPEVAAFVGEPISGASRAAEVPPSGFWPAVAELCAQNGVLFVADEVMTGFGRTGRWFGIEHWPVRPDLMICGKGASSGYWPLGLAIASGSVFEAIKDTFVHGFTYSHHPAGAAAGLAVLDVLESEHLVEASARQGKRLRDRLEPAFPGRVQGEGLLVGVLLDRGRDDVVRAARDLGLLVYPAAIEAVVLGPPLTISDKEIDLIVDLLTVASA